MIRTVKIAVLLLMISSDAALADYITTISNPDGTRTRVHSIWSSKSSKITQFDAKGKKLREETVAGGAGACDVHRAFITAYMMPGSTLRAVSPSKSSTDCINR
jgi:hypothetical protein